jgi:hypothetical protein
VYPPNADFTSKQRPVERMPHLTGKQRRNIIVFVCPASLARELAVCGIWVGD